MKSIQLLAFALVATSALTAAAETITGSVNNPDGTPAADIFVTVMPRSGSPNTTTDQSGHYSVNWNREVPGDSGRPGPAYCVLVRDFKRNLAAAGNIEESTTNLDLRLATSQTLFGRVEDQNGKPLTNATFHVVFWTGNMGEWIDQDKIKVDSKGRFETAALPHERHYGIGVTAPGCGSADWDATSSADDRIEVPVFVLNAADQKTMGRVVDADEKPVAGARVYVGGNGQPQTNILSGDEGEFSLNLCEGSVYISASGKDSYGSVRAQGGDTNLVIILGVQNQGPPQPKKRRSLAGSPLPDLATIGFTNNAAPAGKPVLLCFFDVEQRPSRRFAHQVANQYDALRKKGVTLLGVQAAVISADALKEWQTANPVPFPIACVAEKSPKTKWVSDIDSLPWLILTDGKGQVTAEGFGLDELEAKLALKP